MKNRFLILLAIFFLVPVWGVFAQDDEGIFFDWSIRSAEQVFPPGSPYYSIEETQSIYLFPQFIPIVHPSDSLVAPDSGLVDFLTGEASANIPCALLLHNSTGPLDPVTSDPATAHNLPGAMAAYIGAIPRLDYALADLEPTSDPAVGPTTDTDVENNMTTVVNMVRGSSNPSIKNAWIGNYGFFPGTIRVQSFPNQDDNTGRSNYYLSSGMNVAQPACYCYSSYVTHTTETAYGNYWGNAGYPTSPNERAAIFWGPLELLSTASRNLPAGDKLLAWVSIFEYIPGYNCAVPELADIQAAYKHYRMRGASGISRLDRYDVTNDIPTNSWLLSYTGDQNRNDILNMWHEVDDYFGAQTTSFMNLTTTQTNGLEWSGVRYGNHVRTLVSNLDATNSHTATYPSGWGDLPAASASVPANTHQEFNYTITNLFANSTFNTNIAPWVATGTSAWSATGGAGNGPCLKLSGSQYAAYYYSPCPTDANAAMVLSVTASANVWGAQLGCQFYCLDANKAIISGLVGSAGPVKYLTSTPETYTFQFNVPDDSRVKYIEPIFYDYRYNTYPGDIIYVDNAVLNFKDDSNLLSNSTFDTGASPWYPTGTGAWSATGGMGNGPSLKLSGGFYAAMYYGPTQCATYALADMTFKVYAQANNAGAQLGCSFYCLDSTGTSIPGLIGSAGPAQVIPTATDSTHFPIAPYTFHFTVPNDPRIAYIEPILYNVRYNTNPSDVIYVDNASLKVTDNSNLMPNSTFHTDASPWYMTASSSWSTTGGVNNGPCIELAGGPYAALYYSSGQCATSANANMVFYISASANNAGALLGCSYYCMDANGNYLGEVGSAGPNQTLTTTLTTYAFHFTVPNDPNIKSIEPILYNNRVGTSPTDTIYVDNLRLQNR